MGRQAAALAIWFDCFNGIGPAVRVMVDNKNCFNVQYLNKVTNFDHPWNHYAATCRNIASDVRVDKLPGQKIDRNHVSFDQIFVRRDKNHNSIDTPGTGRCSVNGTHVGVGPMCTACVVARNEQAIAVPFIMIILWSAKVDSKGMLDKMSIGFRRCVI